MSITADLTTEVLRILIIERCTLLNAPSSEVL
jgi:hypothetical protein